MTYTLHEAAYKAHLATPHFRAYKDGTPHMIKSLSLVPMHPLDTKGMKLIFKKMRDISAGDFRYGLRHRAASHRHILCRHGEHFSCLFVYAHTRFLPRVSTPHILS